jgi:hypothetical protein
MLRATVTETFQGKLVTPSLLPAWQRQQSNCTCGTRLHVVQGYERWEKTGTSILEASL